MGDREIPGMCAKNQNKSGMGRRHYADCDCEIRDTGTLRLEVLKLRQTVFRCLRNCHLFETLTELEKRTNLFWATLNVPLPRATDPDQWQSFNCQNVLGYNLLSNRFGCWHFVTVEHVDLF